MLDFSDLARSGTAPLSLSVGKPSKKKNDGQVRTQSAGKDQLQARPKTRGAESDLPELNMMLRMNRVEKRQKNGGDDGGGDGGYSQAMESFRAVIDDWAGSRDDSVSSFEMSVERVSGNGDGGGGGNASSSVVSNPGGQGGGTQQGGQVGGPPGVIGKAKDGRPSTVAQGGNRKNAYSAYTQNVPTIVLNSARPKPVRHSNANADPSKGSKKSSLSSVAAAYGNSNALKPANAAKPKREVVSSAREEAEMKAARPTSHKAVEDKSGAGSAAVAHKQSSKPTPTRQTQASASSSSPEEAARVGAGSGKSETSDQSVPSTTAITPQGKSLTSSTGRKSRTRPSDGNYELSPSPPIRVSDETFHALTDFTSLAEGISGAVEIVGANRSESMTVVPPTSASHSLATSPVATPALPGNMTSGLGLSDIGAMGTMRPMDRGTNSRNLTAEPATTVVVVVSEAQSKSAGQSSAQKRVSSTPVSSSSSKPRNRSAPDISRESSSLVSSNLIPNKDALSVVSRSVVEAADNEKIAARNEAEGFRRDDAYVNLFNDGENMTAVERPQSRKLYLGNTNVVAEESSSPRRKLVHSAGPSSIVNRNSTEADGPPVKRTASNNDLGGTKHSTFAQEVTPKKQSASSAVHSHQSDRNRSRVTSISSTNSSPENYGSSDDYNDVRQFQESDLAAREVEMTPNTEPVSLRKSSVGTNLFKSGALRFPEELDAVASNYSREIASNETTDRPSNSSISLHDMAHLGQARPPSRQKVAAQHLFGETRGSGAGNVGHSSVGGAQSSYSGVSKDVSQFVGATVVGPAGESRWAANSDNYVFDTSDFAAPVTASSALGQHQRGAQKELIGIPSTAPALCSSSNSGYQMPAPTLEQQSQQFSNSFRSNDPAADGFLDIAYETSDAPFRIIVNRISSPNALDPGRFRATSSPMLSPYGSNANSPSRQNLEKSVSERQLAGRAKDNGQQPFSPFSEMSDEMDGLCESLDSSFPGHSTSKHRPVGPPGVSEFNSFQYSSASSSAAANANRTSSSGSLRAGRRLVSVNPNQVLTSIPGRGNGGGSSNNPASGGWMSHSRVVEVDRVGPRSVQKQIVAQPPMLYGQEHRLSSTTLHSCNSGAAAAPRWGGGDAGHRLDDDALTEVPSTAEFDPMPSLMMETLESSLDEDFLSLFAPGI